MERKIIKNAINYLMWSYYPEYVCVSTSNIQNSLEYVNSSSNRIYLFINFKKNSIGIKALKLCNQQNDEIKLFAVADHIQTILNAGKWNTPFMSILKDLSASATTNY